MVTDKVKSERETANELVEAVIEQTQSMGKLLRDGDGAYHMRKLIKVYDWAVAQLPYKVGDSVIVYAGPFARDHGFAPYNDIWRTRPVGVVDAVEFNGNYDYWGFGIRLFDLPEKLFMFSALSLGMNEESQ